MQDTQNRYYGVFAFTLAAAGIFMDGRLIVACFVLLSIHRGCRSFVKQLWLEGYGSLRNNWSENKQLYATIPLFAAFYVNVAIIYTELSKSIPVLKDLVEWAELIYADVTVIQTVVLAPIIEEIVFRRVLLNFFKHEFSPTISTLLVSLLFATGHPHNFVPTFLLSYVACVFVIKTKSLWPSTIMHFLINASITLSWIFFDSFNLLFEEETELGFAAFILLICYFAIGTRVDCIQILKMPKISWNWSLGAFSKKFLTAGLCIFVIGSALAIQVKYLHSKKILSNPKEEYNLNLIAIQQTPQAEEYPINNYMSQRAYHFMCTGNQSDKMTCKVFGMKADWSQPSSEEPKVFKQNCEVEVTTSYRRLEVNKITENLWSGKGLLGSIVKIDLEKHAVVINDWRKKKDVDYVVLESKYTKKKPKLKRNAQATVLGAGKQTKVSWESIQLHEYQSTKRKHYFLNTKRVFGCVVSNVVVSADLL